jgi:electron transfer flavoprotein beta subunit
MKIACFAKYSLDPANLAIDRATGTIDFERSTKKVSEADVNGVEEAVRIKSSSSAIIHIFMVGPSEALKSLKELVAMGADKGFLITDPLFFIRDAFTTATILYEGLRKFGPYDLILGGHASEDNYTGSVSLMVAEMLSIPHIAYVSKLNVSPDSIIAERLMDGRTEVVKGTCPLLLTVTRELNSPRYVTTVQLLRVPRDSVATLKLTDFGITQEKVFELELQQRVALTPMKSNRKKVIIDGSDPVSASKQLISFLRSDQVI